MMDGETSEIKARLAHYQSLVARYEALDKEIDTLIMKNGGVSKNMSDEDRSRYHQLAQQRRELQNEMRIIEQELFEEE